MGFDFVEHKVPNLGVDAFQELLGYAAESLCGTMGCGEMESQLADGFAIYVCHGWLLLLVNINFLSEGCRPALEGDNVKVVIKQSRTCCLNLHEGRFVWIPTWKRVDGLIFESAGVGNANLFWLPDCHGVALLAKEIGRAHV